MSEITHAKVPDEGYQHEATTTVATTGSTFGNAPPASNAPSTVYPDKTRVRVLDTNTHNTAGFGMGPQTRTAIEDMEVFCGPLLNYRRMSQGRGQARWHGSVLIVVSPGAPQLELSFHCLGRVDIGTGTGAPRMVGGTSQAHTVKGEKLYEDSQKGFWRFLIELPIQDFEAKWEYSIQSIRFDAIWGAKFTFVVPSSFQSMRIMFHSCNGFSVGTDIDAWSGPALWNDVLRMHQAIPFHVMIGGGDQIYNDSVRVDGPLRPWTDIANHKKRREFPFHEELREKCDDYYYNNYIKWYSAEPFKGANCSIPQLNIWDDHDIIDGFGSYTDHFMRCPVFRGIGGVAHKYYLLFQHHVAPPKSTFTTHASQTSHATEKTTADSIQLRNTFVMNETTIDPSFIIGHSPGPYVEECSRSIYCQLGARIAFVGIDARIERTRKQVNYPETYELIFQRLDRELSANPNIKHLILLLGVPIAYPRLQWLENIFRSPIIGPIRFLNRRFGFAGSFFNQFDGQVDLLDDLDDHYTAHHHKAERKSLILRLQQVAKQYSIRISILGGDVHLCAIGRFYSNPSENISVEQDWRYMPNIISSAITNKPPPKAVADLLARRNKIHHLDKATDETLLEIFNHDPGMDEKNSRKDGMRPKTNTSNHCTMPSRNYAIIAESNDFSTSSSHANGGTIPPIDDTGIPGSTNKGTKNPRLPIHVGEENAGTQHPAASGLARTGLCGEFGLDVTLRVEISNKDPNGMTEGYGFTIPGLDCKPDTEERKI